MRIRWMFGVLALVANLAYGVQIASLYVANDGVQLANGAYYVPSGVQLANGPYYVPSGVQLANGPYYVPSGLQLA